MCDVIKILLLSIFFLGGGVFLTSPLSFLDVFLHMTLSSASSICCYLLQSFIYLHFTDSYFFCFRMNKTLLISCLVLIFVVGAFAPFPRGDPRLVIFYGGLEGRFDISSHPSRKIQHQTKICLEARSL